MELIRNAVRATAGRARVNLSASAPPPAGRVLLRVVDNGPGMDERTLASAFTPFFSHRRAGRGRGLGLPRARQAVQANGGRIWIESRPRKGTTVCLELPRAGGEAPQP